MALGLLFFSCSKDPVFEKGEYIYEHNDLTKLDNTGGILIHWPENITVSEEQKTVIREIVADMVKVQGGTFAMGAQSTDPSGVNYDAEAMENESPVHNVTLSDYYINRFEITQRQWTVIMGYSCGWQQLYGLGDNMPAYNISHEMATAFIQNLNMLSRLNFKLPTEAEWEYAARGGNQSQHYYFSGSNDANEVAWHNANTDAHLHNVGEKKANELGLYDMSGNVWEWCYDYYAPYTNSDVTNPAVTQGTKRVLRGGGWTYLPTYSRVSCRDQYDANACSVANGFRVALNYDEYR